MYEEEGFLEASTRGARNLEFLPFGSSLSLGWIWIFMCGQEREESYVNFLRRKMRGGCQPARSENLERGERGNLIICWTMELFVSSTWWKKGNNTVSGLIHSDNISNNNTYIDLTSSTAMQQNGEQQQQQSQQQQPSGPLPSSIQSFVNARPGKTETLPCTHQQQLVTKVPPSSSLSPRRRRGKSCKNPSSSSLLSPKFFWGEGINSSSQSKGRWQHNNRGGGEPIAWPE